MCTTLSIANLLFAHALINKYALGQDRRKGLEANAAVNTAFRYEITVM